MTFDKLLEEYFKHRILRPASIANYQEARRNLQRFFHSIGRNLPALEDLTTDDLLQHRAWSLASTAATSYNKHRRHLRALINFAVSEGHLPSSPLAKVTPAPQSSRRPKVVATSWYRRACALLDQPQVQGLNPTEFWHTVLSVMHFTAMRRRQIVELRWDDVIWSRSALVLSSDGSKSRKEWTVPIPRWLMADIRALQERTQARLGQAPSGDDQVFCLPVFAPRIKSPEMTEEHVSRAFVALSRHLGYIISPHRVRHTSATAMLVATGHLKGVSDMLGHTDIKLTASTYVHPQLGHLRRVQAVLSGYKPDMQG